jgi:hypothetical protein
MVITLKVLPASLSSGVLRKTFRTEERMTSLYGGAHVWLQIVKLFLSWSLGCGVADKKPDGTVGSLLFFGAS